MFELSNVQLTLLNIWGMRCLFSLEPNKNVFVHCFLDLWGRICFTSPWKFFEEMAFLVENQGSFGQILPKLVLFDSTVVTTIDLKQ